MTFRQLAKQLDKNAMLFVKQGDLKKAFAAMEFAAVIRRQPKEVLRYSADELFGEN
jgi:hypothetical protein